MCVACAFIGVLGGLAAAIIFLWSTSDMVGDAVYMVCFSVATCGVLGVIFGPKLFYAITGAEVDENMQVKMKTAGYAGGTATLEPHQSGTESQLLLAESRLIGRSKDDQYAICKQQIELWTARAAQMEIQWSSDNSSSGSKRTKDTSRPVQVHPLGTEL